MKEETLSSSYLYRGKIVNVRQDRVRLPDGRIASREVVEHPGAVGVLAVDELRNVILVRQHRQPVRSIMLEIPAGKLDPGEEPLQCARRELEEETGLQGSKWSLLGSFYLSPGFCDEIIHLFLTEDLAASEPVTTDEDETVESLTIPLEEARRMVQAGEIRDAKTIIALNLAHASTA